jgi:hypothetical protein
MRYHPHTSAALVVSHHPDGLSHPMVLGLLRPSTGQDSLRFGHTRPEPKPWPFACRSRQRHSHPSKISPRWQPYRITAAVAPSTSAEYPCLSQTSQPARLSCTLTRCAHRIRRPTRTPNGCSRPPFPEKAPTTDRRPSGSRIVADTTSSRSHLCSPSAAVHRRVSSPTNLGTPPPAGQRPVTQHLSHTVRLDA